MADKVNVNEIYGPIIQGEGKRTGQRSSFVRTNGCSLRCEWADPKTGDVVRCDTPYTSWFPEVNNMMTTEEIAQQLKSYEHQSGDLIRDVIVSGGEPMMQKGVDGLVEHLVNEGKYVTMETNGTFYRDMNQHPQLYSISPKLESSTPTSDLKMAEMHTKNNRFDQSMPKFVGGLERGLFDAQFKFVYNQPEDIGEIEKFREQYGIDKTDVWLMAMGDTRDLQMQNTKPTMDAAIENGYNMSGRLHVIAYSDKRGV